MTTTHQRGSRVKRVSAMLARPGLYVEEVHQQGKDESELATLDWPNQAGQRCTGNGSFKVTGCQGPPTA